METKSLTLIPITIPHVEKLIDGHDAFEAAYNMPVSDGYLEWPEVLPAMLDALRKEPPTDWGAYLIIHRVDNTLIGMGGFKGNPDDQGCVEIGYGIASAYRGRGYATEAAQAWVDHAFTDPTIRAVTAHTLGHDNPSTRVLQKVGMVKTDEINDPDDGLVWRWEIARS